MVRKPKAMLWGGIFPLVILSAILIAGCARLTYEETPTVAENTTPATSASPEATQVIPSAVPAEQPASGPGVTALRVEPSVLDVEVGTTRLVQVWIDNANDLNGIELHIGFEPNYVQIEDALPGEEGVQVGPGVLPVPAQIEQNRVDNDAGRIVYQAAQTSGQPVSGSGMVASFTLRALADGGSPLQFEQVTLTGPAGETLPAPEQLDGLVVIGSGEGVDIQEPATEPAGTSTSPTLPPPAPTSPPLVADTYHTVQAGENLFRIAMKYGTTVEAIVAANNLPNENAIQEGQELLIPAGSPPAGPTPGTTDGDTYVVQPGDTLFSIAQRFNTTVETLAALNGIAPPYTIEVGQELIVTP